MSVVQEQDEAKNLEKDDMNSIENVYRYRYAYDKLMRNC